MAGTVYPKWKYHESFEAVIVKDAAKEKELGDKWADTPAAFGVVTAPAEGHELKLKPKAKK